MTRTDTLRERRLKKQMQMRALQAQIDDIDAEILVAHRRETHAGLRERRLAIGLVPAVQEAAA